MANAIKNFVDEVKGRLVDKAAAVKSQNESRKLDKQLVTQYKGMLPRVPNTGQANKRVIKELVKRRDMRTAGQFVYDKVADYQAINKDLWSKDEMKKLDHLNRVPRPDNTVRPGVQRKVIVKK